MPFTLGRGRKDEETGLTSKDEEFIFRSIDVFVREFGPRSLPPSNRVNHASASERSGYVHAFAVYAVDITTTSIENTANHLCVRTHGVSLKMQEVKIPDTALSLFSRDGINIRRNTGAYAAPRVIKWFIDDQDETAVMSPVDKSGQTITTSLGDKWTTVDPLGSQKTVEWSVELKDRRRKRIPEKIRVIFTTPFDVQARS
ncbi:hypothetical protein JCM3765_003510 [Sporobolomyces pararoseus]